MTSLVLFLIFLIVIILASTGILDGGVVRNYHCEKCNEERGLQTYIPQQTTPPSCNRCGNTMTEYNDI